VNEESHQGNAATMHLYINNVSEVINFLHIGGKVKGPTYDLFVNKYNHLEVEQPRKKVVLLICRLTNSPMSPKTKSVGRTSPI
jgi:hypothetical protein